MTPTSFEFTLTIPGDPRLVGVARQLAAQAAGYAQLTAEAGGTLAGHVERATEAAVDVADARQAPIELRFFGEQGTVNVQIACDATHGSGPPRSSQEEGVTVEWSTNGSRHVCHIRQRVPA